jgi:hypothetical protein
MSVYQSALDDVLTFSEARGRSILERPAVMHDIDSAAVLAEWNKPIYDEVYLRDAKTLKSLVEKLEAQGVTIMFYEVPYSPIISQTRCPTMVRKAMAQVFYVNDSRWLDVKYPADELRWTRDAAHLDESRGRPEVAGRGSNGAFDLDQINFHVGRAIVQVAVARLTNCEGWFYALHSTRAARIHHDARGSGWSVAACGARAAKTSPRRLHGQLNHGA